MQQHSKTFYQYLEMFVFVLLSRISIYMLFQMYCIFVHFIFQVDVLISNAGRSQRASWAETELAVDKELFELNVFSLINLNRIIVRHWLKVGQPGQLCIMSSVAGKMGVYHSGSYSGSKFALHGYFDSLRNETRNNGIDITIICPGPVFSPILKQAFTSQAGKVRQFYFIQIHVFHLLGTYLSGYEPKLRQR